MDYKAMAAAIKLCGSTPKFDQCKKECPYWDDGHMNKCIPRMTEDAATAITDLLARAEESEAREKNLIESVQMITARAENAEKENKYVRSAICDRCFYIPCLKSKCKWWNGRDGGNE